MPGQDIAGDDQAVINPTQDGAIRGQGFQGQVQGQGLYDFSLARPSQETDSEQPNRDSAGSFNNEDIIGNGAQPVDGMIDDAYEYDDFFSGLQNEMMQQSSGSGVQKEGQSQILPTASQDLFQEDGILDSTKGLRNMLSQKSPSKTEEQA